MKSSYIKFIIIFAGLLALSPQISISQENTQKPPPQPMSETSFFGNTLMFMVAGFLGYYMLVTRPQQIQDQEQKAIIEKIKKNDQVLINPGIFGKVVQVLDGEVTVDIGTSGNSLKVKVVPSALTLPTAKSEEKSQSKN